MEELIQLVTKTYGLVGLLILAPLVGLIFVYRDLKKTQSEFQKSEKEWADRLQKCERDCSDKLSSVGDKVVSSQLQRVADAQAISSKLIEIVSEQSSLNKETNIALDRLNDALSLMRRP